MTTYVIRTANGYVGRWDLSSELVDTMPRGMAYTFPREDAERVAASFTDSVVEEM